MAPAPIAPVNYKPEWQVKFGAPPPAAILAKLPHVQGPEQN